MGKKKIGKDGKISSKEGFQRLESQMLDTVGWVIISERESSMKARQEK